MKPTSRHRKKIHIIVLFLLQAVWATRSSPTQFASFLKTVDSTRKELTCSTPPIYSAESVSSHSPALSFSLNYH